MSRLQQQLNGVQYHASQCLSALESAAFAESEPLLAGEDGLPTGLRKLAAYHAENAFQWVRPGLITHG
jgi:hypothetical protein